jgi:hypothetical protein
MEPRQDAIRYQDGSTVIGRLLPQASLWQQGLCDEPLARQQERAWIEWHA